MISDVKWEELFVQIQLKAERMACEAIFYDGIELPFSIEATDADGHVLATGTVDIYEADEDEESCRLALPELNSDRTVFSQQPVLLTLRNEEGVLKRMIVDLRGIEPENPRLQDESKLIH